MLAVGSHSDERGWRANRLVSDIQVHKKKSILLLFLPNAMKKSLQLVERPKKFENKLRPFQVSPGRKTKTSGRSCVAVQVQLGVVKGPTF